MADITVRKEALPSTQPVTTGPSRDLLRMDPFREMPSLLRAWGFPDLAPLFNAPQFNALTPTAFWPAFEVKETGDTYLFKADVPGVKEADIEVTVTGNRLNISGTRNEEKEERTETYYSCERQYGSFNRAFTLPDGADLEHVHAGLQAGVLTVAIPKKANVQPKKIQVKATPNKA